METLKKELISKMKFRNTEVQIITILSSEEIKIHL